MEKESLLEKKIFFMMLKRELLLYSCERARVTMVPPVFTDSARNAYIMLLGREHRFRL